MRKLIFITILMGQISIVFAQKSFYERVHESDSIFSIYLEEDTISSIYSVLLVFDNKSQDSIVLVSNFENFLTKFSYSPGILINFYVNHELGMPVWGSLYPQYYRFSEGRIPISPLSVTKFPISLPNIGKIRDDIEKGIDFEIFYRFYNVTQRKASSFYTKTNYLNLKYLKRFEEKDKD